MKCNLGKMVEVANRDWKDSKATMTVQYNPELTNATRMKLTSLIKKLKKYKEELK